MKARELLDLAQEELYEEQQENVLNILKESIKTVDEARKTYLSAKKTYKKILEMDIEEFEDLEY